MASRIPGTRAVPRLREISLADLQEDLPVFPLPGALLLPRGRLPLNIFEPRYVAMIDDALRSRRLIGMVQPQGVEIDDDEEDEQPGSGAGSGSGSGSGPWSESDLDPEPDEPAGFALRGSAPMIARDRQPALYHVGCAGRLSSFVEREDGTYAVTLVGIARFRVRQECDLMHGYRRVTPDFSSFADDLVEPGPIAFDREALIAALRRFFAQRGFEARWEAIDQMDDETLIITLSMICPFPVAEKQALLEAPTVSLRARTLLALLQMAGHETDDGRKPHAV